MPILDPTGSIDERGHARPRPHYGRDMSYEQILTSVDDGVLTITMNRPERLNAWTPRMGGGMMTAIDAANDDRDIEGMILTGAGRGFCAGADIEAVFKAQVVAHAHVRAMGENPQVALRTAKQLLTQNATETDLDEVIKREGRALRACYASAEHKEAIAAFMEKREPDFRAARGAQ